MTYKDINQTTQTNRLLIRPFCINDTEDVYTLLDSDTDVTEYTGGIKSVQESSKHLENLINRQSQSILTPQAVILKTTGKLIGYCGFEPFMLDKDKTEITYGIAKKHWHNGFASEAAKAILAVGFQEYNLDLVVAAVNPNNIASLKVITKLGFTFKKKISWPNQGLVNYYTFNKSMT